MNSATTLHLEMTSTSLHTRDSKIKTYLLLRIRLARKKQNKFSLRLETSSTCLSLVTILKNSKVQWLKANIFKMWFNKQLKRWILIKNISLCREKILHKSFTYKRCPNISIFSLNLSHNSLSSVTPEIHRQGLSEWGLNTCSLRDFATNISSNSKSPSLTG